MRVPHVVEACGPSAPHSSHLTSACPCLRAWLQSALAEERSLVPALLSLLDHTAPLLRAKGVVAILLLCRCVPRCAAWG